MTKRIPGQSLTLVKVLPPLISSTDDFLTLARSHISCIPYIDQEHWDGDFNDKLYESGRAGTAWSHLQVRKSQLLERWPRVVSTSVVEQGCYRWLLQEAQSFPKAKPNSREWFWAEAKRQFPTLARRQFTRVWRRAIEDSGANWSQSGRLRKSNRDAS
jgi:hypothetical protein